MKIGIITPFDSRNFGNRLQNYALQQVLWQYAETVVTIKNKPALPGIRERLRRGTPLAESIWVNRLLGEKRKARILEFNRKYLTISNHTYWYNRLHQSLKPEDRCDWYCAGSDQIWNPELGREGPFNYLVFAPREKTFSYAASFGVAQITPKAKEKVRWGLQNIRFLSVREEAGREIIQQLTGRTDVEVLPDPTLMLTRNAWDEVAQKPRKSLPKAYVLSYFLGEAPENRQRKIEALGLEVISLMDPNSPFYAIGPGEFLYLIRHARLVCTDSFHGSVFSFLYQRPLAIFPREGEGSNMGSRLEWLLSHYQLQSCAVEEETILSIPEKADYSRGYKILEEDRLRARDFLNRIFLEAKI